MSLKRKEFAPGGSELFPFRAVPYTLENQFYHNIWPPLNVTIFNTHMRMCVMGEFNIRSPTYIYAPRTYMVGRREHGDRPSDQSIPSLTMYD